MGGSLPDWELGRRKRVHSEEKSNKCKQCDITYLVAQLLMKTHNGEKSNQFSQCSAGGLDKGGPTGMGESHPDWELGRRGVMRCSYRMPSLECGIVADADALFNLVKLNINGFYANIPNILSYQ